MNTREDEKELFDLIQTKPHLQNWTFWIDSSHIDGTDVYFYTQRNIGNARIENSFVPGPRDRSLPRTCVSRAPGQATARRAALSRARGRSLLMAAVSRAPGQITHQGRRESGPVYRIVLTSSLFILPMVLTNKSIGNCYWSRDSSDL